MVVLRELRTRWRRSRLKPLLRVAIRRWRREDVRRLVLLLLLLRRRRSRLLVMDAVRVLIAAIRRRDRVAVPGGPITARRRRRRSPRPGRCAAVPNGSSGLGVPTVVRWWRRRIRRSVVLVRVIHGVLLLLLLVLVLLLGVVPDLRRSRASLRSGRGREPLLVFRLEACKDESTCGTS